MSKQFKENSRIQKKRREKRALKEFRRLKANSVETGQCMDIEDNNSDDGFAEFFKNFYKKHSITNSLSILWSYIELFLLILIGMHKIGTEQEIFLNNFLNNLNFGINDHKLITLIILIRILAAISLMIGAYTVCKSILEVCKLRIF